MSETRKSKKQKLFRHSSTFYRKRAKFKLTGLIDLEDLPNNDQRYPEHHQVDKTSDEIVLSPLEKLPIDMVRDIPIADSLHLIDLGIVKRCLVGWVRGSYNFRIKLFASQINDISSWLKDCNRFLPNDIHRSIRGLDHLSFWKASEYRTFLFYLGPIILKEHLGVETYKHFLLLFCAISLLSTNYYVSQENYLNAANQMLNDYIEMFISLYGMDSVSSNVHNLCHVVEDVRRFGCLPNISTYKFENELGKIVNMLRSGNRPLAQIAKRVMEKKIVSNPRSNHIKKKETSFKYPIPNNNVDARDVHFKQFSFQGIVFKNDSKNQWFLTKNNDIVRMTSACGTQENPKIFGCSMKHLENFFVYPLKSKHLNVYLSKKSFNSCKYYLASEIKCKLFGIEKNDSFIFLPLLHTLDLFNNI